MVRIVFFLRSIIKDFFANIVSSYISSYRTQMAIHNCRNKVEPSTIRTTLGQIEFCDCESGSHHFSNINSESLSSSSLKFFEILESDSNIKAVFDSFTTYPYSTIFKVKKMSTKRYKMNNNSRDIPISQWAFVSGATGGIGSHISSILACSQIPTIITGRNVQKLAKMALRMALEGVKVRVIRLDLADSSNRPTMEKCKDSDSSDDSDLDEPSDQCDRFVSPIPKYIPILSQLLDKVDIRMVYLNAGGGEFCSYESLSHSAIQKQIDLNFVSYVFLSQYFIQNMHDSQRLEHQKRIGSLTFTCSLVGATPMPFLALYSSNKTAIAGLTRSLSSEYRGMGIDIGCGCPGAVSGTEFYKRELTSNRIGGSSSWLLRNIDSLIGTPASKVACELMTVAPSAKAVHMVGSMARFGFKCQNIFGRRIMDGILTIVCKLLSPLIRKAEENDEIEE
ncbi:Short-chain dehydrogenase/reductase SDR like protein [Aduncisulcus paluster]|uniref:Short-chain dehydrogenase/reductase SDR like protein n=1 Tax=Aduncisulcus paluster TaxID=2918883 RepID=A0ABQ5KSB2_9EUKA|nr:Short-chain dehydrogenase/reductase SDR like protein [Aduncisulcus paluster]